MAKTSLIDILIRDHEDDMALLSRIGAAVCGALDCVDCPVRRMCEQSILMGKCHGRVVHATLAKRAAKHENPSCRGNVHRSGQCGDLNYVRGLLFCDNVDTCREECPYVDECELKGKTAVLTRIGKTLNDTKANVAYCGFPL